MGSPIRSCQCTHRKRRLGDGSPRVRPCDLTWRIASGSEGRPQSHSCPAYPSAQFCAPASSIIGTMLVRGTTCWCHIATLGIGTWHWPSAGGNDLLPALMVPYSTFYNSSVGITLVLPVLSLIRLDMEFSESFP